MRQQISFQSIKPLYIPILLGLILILAVVLRFHHIDYGLPLLLYEDEPIYYRRALNVGLGAWDPQYFKKPSFFLYFYAAVFWVNFLWQQMKGLGTQTWDTFVNLFWSQPMTLAIWGRSVSAAISLATVASLFVLARRVTRLAHFNHLPFNHSQWIALLSALFLAVDVTHLKYSPIVIADIPALFWITLTAWNGLRLFEYGRWCDYLLTALCTVLVISFKYNFFVGIFLVMAHLGYCYKTVAAQQFQAAQEQVSLRSWLTAVILSKPFWVAVMLIPIGFFCLSPFALLNFSQFWQDLQLEKQHMLLRNAYHTTRTVQPMIGFDNIFFHIFPKMFGWPAYILGLLTAIYLVYRGIKKGDQDKKNDQDIAQSRWVLGVFFSFPLLFLLTLSQFRLINAKYLIPILPFWHTLCAIGLVSAIQFVVRLSKPFKPAVVGVVFGAGLLLACLLPQWKALSQYLETYRQPDTRTTARFVLYQALNVNQQIYIEPETIPVLTWYPDRESGGYYLRTGSEIRRRKFVGPPEAGLLRFQPEWVLIQLKPFKSSEDKPILRYSPEYYTLLAKQYECIAIYSPFEAHSTEHLPFRLANSQAFLNLYEALKKDHRRAQGPLMLLFHRF